MCVASVLTGTVYNRKEYTSHFICIEVKWSLYMNMSSIVWKANYAYSKTRCPSSHPSRKSCALMLLNFNDWSISISNTLLSHRIKVCGTTHTSWMGDRLGTESWNMHSWLRVVILMTQIYISFLASFTHMGLFYCANQGARNNNTDWTGIVSKRICWKWMLLTFYCMLYQLYCFLGEWKWFFQIFMIGFLGNL